MAFNVGHPQTRKSQMTKLIEVFSYVLDSHLRSVAFGAAADNGDNTAGLKLASVALTSFTPVVFVERFSGDFRLVVTQL